MQLRTYLIGGVIASVAVGLASVSFAQLKGGSDIQLSAPSVSGGSSGLKIPIEAQKQQEAVTPPPTASDKDVKKKEDPMTAQKKKCDEENKKNADLCANKKTANSDKCDGAKLKSNARLMPRLSEGGATSCLSEKAAVDMTKNTACACKEGITDGFVDITTINPATAARKEVKCFQETGEKNSKNKTEHKVTFCTEDEEKLTGKSTKVATNQKGETINEAISSGTAAPPPDKKTPSYMSSSSQPAPPASKPPPASATSVPASKNSAPQPPAPTAKASPSVTQQPQTYTASTPPAPPPVTRDFSQPAIGTASPTTASSAVPSVSASAPAAVSSVSAPASSGGSAPVSYSGESGAAPAYGAVPSNNVRNTSVSSVGSARSAADAPAAQRDSRSYASVPTYASSSGSSSTSSYGGRSLDSSSFFAQFLATPKESGTPQRAADTQVYPQYAPKSRDIRVPPAPVTTSQQQTARLRDDQAAFEKNLRELEALLAAEKVAKKSPAKPRAEPTKSPEQGMLEQLAQSPGVEELVRIENKKALAQRKAEQVETKRLIDDAALPAVAVPVAVAPVPKSIKEMTYELPKKIALNITNEQNILASLGIKTEVAAQPINAPTATVYAIPTVSAPRVEAPSVRIDIARTVAALTSAYSGAIAPAESVRDAFAQQASSASSRVEAIAYSADYESSVRVLALAKQLEVLSFRVSSGEEPARVRASLDAVRTALTAITPAKKPPPLTLATLPTSVSAWTVRHFNFYSSHIKALAQKSSTDTAKVLYSDAAQLVSRASVGSAARPWQWNLQADIETAQKKVTLAQSLDRDATRTKAAQNTPSDPKKGILETLKSVFGL